MERTLFKFPKDADRLPQGPCYIEAVWAADALVVEMDTGKFHTLALHYIQQYATVIINKPKIEVPKTAAGLYQYLKRTLGYIQGFFEKSNTFDSLYGSWTITLETDGIKIQDTSSFEGINNPVKFLIPDETLALFLHLNLPYEDFTNVKA